MHRSFRPCNLCYSRLKKLRGTYLWSSRRALSDGKYEIDLKKLLIIKIFSLKKKKRDFFDLFFFWKRVLKGFPVCQRPGTFITGGINVWTLRRCGSEINFWLLSLQNGARITKFSRINSGFFLSEHTKKPRKLLRMKSS